MDRVLWDFGVGVRVTDSMRVCSVIARVWLCLRAVFERSSCGWVDFSCNRIELRTNKFKQASDVGLWLVGLQQAFYQQGSDAVSVLDQTKRSVEVLMQATIQPKCKVSGHALQSVPPMMQHIECTHDSCVRP